MIPRRPKTFERPITMSQMARWTRAVLVLAIVGAAISVVQEAWILTGVAGPQVTAGVDAAATLTAAAIAGACSADRARRSRDRGSRSGWRCMAAAMAAFIAGIVISAVYVVVQGQHYPFPSLADAAYLTSGALEVIAILFIGGRMLATSRVRLLLDGGIVALSVLIVSWVTTMMAIYERTGVSRLTTAVALAYPATNTTQIVITLAAVAHARRLDRTLLLVASGTLAFAISAIDFAQQGNTHPNPVDVGEVIGCLLIAMAAASREPSVGAARSPARSSPWRAGLPYVPVIVVAATMVWWLGFHGTLDSFSLAMVMPLAILVVSRQIVAVVESQRLAEQLGRTAAEQRVLIDQAPTAICRLDADGRILSANFAMQTMFGCQSDWLAGRRLFELVQLEERRPPEAEEAGGRPRALLARAIRPDRLNVWCSVITSSLRDDDGHIDRAVAVIEDVTYRRQQIEMAALIQRQLLPQSPPELPGYRVAGVCIPADDVAGDFYDWHLTADGRLHITVADVMGKGMGAALIMAVLRTAIRGAPPAARPADRLALAAEAIGPGVSGEGFFTTVFQADLDLASGALSYVDAGHGYCAIRRAGGDLAGFGRRSLPLGIREEEAFEEGSAALAPGETLIIYSDGLVERPGSCIGLADLMPERAAPPASELIECLLDRMPAGATDDVTVVVIERLDRRSRRHARAGR